MSSSNTVGANGVQIGGNASAPLNAIRIGSNSTARPIGAATVAIGTNSGAMGGAGSTYSVLIGYDVRSNNDIATAVAIGWLQH